MGQKNPSRRSPIGIMRTTGDHERRILLFHPHTNIGFSFFLTTKQLILFWKNPQYAEMRHGDVILTLQLRHGSTCDRRATDVLPFPRAGTGL